MPTSKKFKEYVCLSYSGALLVSGIVLISLSALFGYKLTSSHFKFIPTECLAPFIILFFLAMLHISLTWLGIRAATTEHLIHILMFMVLTMVLLIAELCVGVWAMVLWGQIAKKAALLMERSFEGFVKIGFDKSDWVNLQMELNCCGINGKKDYTVVDYTSTGSIPISCCNGPSCDTLYSNGCQDPLVRLAKSLVLKIALVGFCSALFQVLGFYAYFKYYTAAKQAAVEKASSLRALRRLSSTGPNNMRVQISATPNSPT